MSASPSMAAPRLFYHPAYWCHSCDMSIGLPPSPTPDALLCPHCHRDSLEQMDIEDSLMPPSPTAPNGYSAEDSSFAAYTPFDDNFLLTNPDLQRLIHQLTTTTSAASIPRSNPASKSSIEKLQEVTITPESDPSMLCPVCKDPFVVNSVVKMMPCKHSYHSDCIVPWLEINNSCPVCRYKLPTVEEARTENRVEGYGGPVRVEELVDDEVDLYGFRNTLRHIARRHRWNYDGNIGSGSGSEGNLFSPTQIGEVQRDDGVLERANSVETVSSWPRWQVEERGGGGGANDDSDAFARS
ncbi:Ubiquitin--protein ligase [Handroanthus impetiginosus]|uniref:RING-type E3 ubiquitin transferase n=1 Tax=Handroanthus impetiginosus TaxID=429701 RepID=A0A2G9GYK7_9LAMI|nr:Ubiquitin--protein ligase [Handroanthus impetiginosus]